MVSALKKRQNKSPAVAAMHLGI